MKLILLQHGNALFVFPLSASSGRMKAKKAKIDITALRFKISSKVFVKQHLTRCNKRLLVDTVEK